MFPLTQHLKEARQWVSLMWKLDNLSQSFGALLPEWLRVDSRPRFRFSYIISWLRSSVTHLTFLISFSSQKIRLITIYCSAAIRVE